MSNASPADLGVFGLGTMGRALALNGADQGHTVLGFDIAAEAVAALGRDTGGSSVRGAASLEEFVAGLARPRRILMMIPAGDPVDSAIKTLRPLLDSSDMLVDGGNSHPRDTLRRAAALEGTGIRFLGMGVSGGEDGARHGPSMMAGGDQAAWDSLAPLLLPMAAQGDLGPCVARVGPGAAGHLVKTVHNGIEYGDMQLLAEAWDLMHRGLGLSAPDAADWFAGYHEGPLRSFLTGITADVLRKKDPATGKPIIEAILDVAGQKGTGRWTAELAIAHGVPAPTLLAAVQGRALSAVREQRLQIVAALGEPSADVQIQGRDEVRGLLADALLASRLAAYSQGFQLLGQLAVDGAAGPEAWQLDLAEVARIWTAGCIIRADVLGPFREVFLEQPGLAHPFQSEAVGSVVQSTEPALRQILALAHECGVPTPALGASLAYITSLRRSRLPQDLTQAQRDAFGAHGFARVDRPADERYHLT